MNGRRHWWPPTIRVRLTLLYAAAFFLAGAVLITLMYLYLGQILNHQSGQTALQHLGVDVQHAVSAQAQRNRAETLNAMLIVSLVTLGVFGVVAAGFGWLLAGRVLQPLQQITATARRVADRSLHERIALQGPNDEVKDLADTLDSMLERLDRAFDTQRRFVANASHELRTPLAINRTLIEVALQDPDAEESLRKLGGTLLAVNLRNERLIDGLLTLAVSEQRITDPARVDLADVARRVATEAQDTAQNAGVDFRTHLRPAVVKGDTVLLERLVQNLVDNAIRYNLPAHGWVTVATDQVQNIASITVENTGPAIQPHEIPNLFEPFRRLPSAERRADHSASISRGAGLGLSIVRSVTHAHGGEVRASPREDGGLTVQVRIPATQEQIRPTTLKR